MSSRLRLAYGYVRVGDAPPERVPVQREALRDLAPGLGRLLDTVFTDYQVRPGTDRPAFRTLLNVVRQLRPYGVLVPSAWHLSPWPVERVGLLEQFGALGCSVRPRTRARRPCLCLAGHATLTVAGSCMARWMLGRRR